MLGRCTAPGHNSSSTPSVITGWAGPLELSISIGTSHCTPPPVPPWMEKSLMNRKPQRWLRIIPLCIILHWFGEYTVGRVYRMYMKLKGGDEVWRAGSFSRYWIGNFSSLSLVLARLTIIDLENRKCCGYRDLPFCNFVYEVNSLRLFRISR